MASTTIDTEPELSAVNAILGAIGQSPVTTIVGNANPEIAFIYNLLRDANVDLQSEGWHFNTERHVKYTPDASTGKIVIASNVLRLDVTDAWTHRQYDVIKRNGFLYDKYDHTDDWSDVTEIYLDVVTLVTFENLPEVPSVLFTTSYCLFFHPSVTSICSISLAIYILFVVASGL